MNDIRSEVKSAVRCDHCGDVCGSEIIQKETLHFCCVGCEAVYDLLQINDLAGHYAEAQKGAKRIKEKSGLERKYDFLERSDVANQLLSFQDDVQSIVKFELPGIHCSSCIYLLEYLPRLDGRVIHSQVHFIKKEISIRFSNALSLKELVLMLCYLGYEPLVSLDETPGTPKKEAKSNLGILIAVAGFCFGNSMLISLPHYLDTDFLQEEFLVKIFSYLNLAFALPVVLIAARPFFENAFRGLRSGFLNIDVPISLGVITLFARSGYEILFQVGPGYVDSLAGLVFFLLLGKWYQSKTYRALSFDRDYKAYFPVSVHRKTDQGEQSTLINDFKVSDLIVLHNQELIPADGIITAGSSSIDYSFVTGEKERVKKGLGEQIYAGGRHFGSPVEIQLTRTVSNSELTRMWNDADFTKHQKKKLDLIIDRVSRYFTLVVLVIASTTAVYWSLIDHSKIWDTVAAVLIVACPCALALAMPFAYGHGMRILGRAGLYLKNADIIEQLQKTQTIIFDKTGTLTNNDSHSISFKGALLTPYQKEMIAAVVANSGHPLSQAIKNHLDLTIQGIEMTDYEEVANLGLKAQIGHSAIKIGSAKWVGTASEPSNNLSEVFISIDGEVLGSFQISTKYRPGIFKVLTQLKQTFTLHLLSGDNDHEAERLAPFFHQMKFGQTPDMKWAHVSSIKKANTLMLGDGINDSGALKAADVGVAVCDDVHQFSPASDALLRADSIGKIPIIITFSKSVMRIVIAAFILSFLYNIIGISFAVSGQLTPLVSAILMPLSSITVVLFITITISWLGRKLEGRKNHLN